MDKKTDRATARRRSGSTKAITNKANAKARATEANANTHTVKADIDTRTGDTQAAKTVTKPSKRTYMNLKLSFQSVLQRLSTKNAKQGTAKTAIGDKNSNSKYIVCAVVISLISTLSLSYLLQKIIPAYNFLYVALFAAEIYGINYYLAKGKFQTKRERICYTVFCLLFSASLVLGTLLDHNISLGYKRLLATFIASLGTGMTLSNLLPPVTAWLSKFLAFQTPVRSKSDWKPFLLCTVILLLTWTPVFLAYYPGIFSYDVGFQLKALSTGELTTHHPLIHTLLLGLFYAPTGNFSNTINHNTGIAIFAIVQSAIFAFSLSYAILFLHRCKFNKIIIAITTAFFALSPAFSMLAISMTKDTLFVSFLVIAMTCIAYAVFARNIAFSKRNILLLIISIIGTCIFRNNGIYVAIPALICIAIYLWHTGTKKQAIAYASYIVTAILISLAIQGLLTSITNASKGSANEALSVPIQQISRTFTKDSDQLNSKEKNSITALLPDVKLYNSALSDPGKSTSKIPQNMGKFVRLYIELLPSNFNRYIEGFLLLNKGYWDMNDLSYMYINSYLLKNTWRELGVTTKTKLPILKHRYDGLFTNNRYSKIRAGFTQIPILSTVLSPALYLWIALAAILYAFAKRRYYALVILAPITILLATMLLGPCVHIRYMLPIIALAPIIIACTFGDIKVVNDYHGVHNG